MTFEGTGQSGSPHHFLSRLAGSWTGTSKLWIEPGKLADESPVIGTIQLILSGRFALYLYQGSIQDEAQSKLPVLGYTVPYAIGNILLTAWGPVIVMLMTLLLLNVTAEGLSR